MKPRFAHLTDSYQQWCVDMCVCPQETRIPYLPLKLVGEAGEVAEKFGKYYRGDYLELPKQAIALELGDTLWYIAVLANELGYTLSDIASMNIDKLNSRRARGVQKGEGDNR